MKPRDPSGPGTIADDPERAPLVLPVLAEVMKRTTGKRQSVSSAEANWIAIVRRIAPDMPYWLCFGLATSYLKASIEGESTEAMDSFLAFAPWRGKENSDAYIRGIRAGWIAETWTLFPASAVEARTLLDLLEADDAAMAIPPPEAKERHF